MEKHKDKWLGYWNGSIEQLTNVFVLDHEALVKELARLFGVEYGNWDKIHAETSGGINIVKVTNIEFIVEKIEQELKISFNEKPVGADTPDGLFRWKLKKLCERIHKIAEK